MQPQDPVGCSNMHESVIDKLKRVAATDAEILITGPTGVGKELYANFAHRHSHRKQHNFVPINCGSLSGDLLENQLFGHVGGAFTGAKAKSEGLVHEAEGGTLFFDEVDSLGTSCQIKLLRFLQDKQYRRLGENHLRQANVRIIAATNVELESSVREKRFRKDLFFRLRVVPVNIPALNKRPQDIQELVRVFTKKCAQKYNLPVVEFSENAIEHMKGYDWPGNIRELENCIDYVTCLQLHRPVEPEDLPLLNNTCLSHSDSEPPESIDIKTFVARYLVDNDQDALRSAKNKLVKNFEKQYIQRALQNTNGNVSAAARMSGKNRRVLFELMRKHQISPDKYRIAQF